MAHLKISDTFSIIIYPQMSNIKFIVNRTYGHKHSKVIFYIPKVIKNTTAMFHPVPINLQAFPADERICPVKNIVENIRASEKFRKSKNVLLSYYKYEPIETQTISRYVKLTLKAAGINTKIFSAHSTRHASSIGRFMTGLSLNDIVKKGG